MIRYRVRNLDGADFDVLSSDVRLFLVEMAYVREGGDSVGLSCDSCGGFRGRRIEHAVFRHAPVP